MTQNKKANLQKTVSPTKGDVVSSASLTSTLTYILITYKGTIQDTHVLFPYLTDVTIPIFSGIFSILSLWVFSLLHYVVKSKKDAWKLDNYLKNCEKSLSLPLSDQDRKKIEAYRSAAVLKHNISSFKNIE